MTISTHLNLAEFAAANAAKDLLDELDDEIDFVPEIQTTTPHSLSRGFRIIPTVLTVCAGLSSAPTHAEYSQHAFSRRVYFKYTEATIGRHDLPLLFVETSSADSSPTSVADLVVAELEKVCDGWAGEGSVAPSLAVLKDVALVLNALPHDAVMPDVEVDEDSGAVALRWIPSEAVKSFSLTFQGTGSVVGVYSTINPPRSFPWTASVDDIKVAAAFEQHGVREAITT